jgi:hypothetical protein
VQTPRNKKTFEVAITEKTEISGLNLEKLKAGDYIKLESDESVFKSEKLNAIKISSPL